MQHSLLYPDYSRSIVNLANSVIAYFGAQSYHPGLSELDEALEAGSPSGAPYKHVLVMVFDAMGSRNLQDWLPPESYLRSHQAAEITSTFPPTTTAATTTLQSGLTPSEHAWLGWRMYFEELGANICPFMNIYDDGTRVSEKKYAREHIPYESIYDRITQAGKAHAYAVSEYGSHHITTLNQLFDSARYLCSRDERSYIYTYWPNPDSYMHREGTCGIDALATVHIVNSMVAELAGQVQDTLIVVTADHGQLDGTNESITRYPELNAYLSSAPSVEPRASSFRLRAGADAAGFEAEFKKHFGNDYQLMTQDQVVESGLFGNKAVRLTDTPAEHPRFREFLGDYMGVAVGTRSLFRNDTEARRFVGIHAGLLEKEMLVPLILFKT